MKQNCFDTDKRLNHNSWTEGGTHITNFDMESLANCVMAIQIYERNCNPSHQLVISGFAYANNGEPISGYSLHQLENKGDLSRFWDIYRELKKTNT
jgi:hypothetical protein